MDSKPSPSEVNPQWVTPILSPEQWILVPGAVVKALELCGVNDVITMHGWTESEFADCPEFESLQWVDVWVMPADLINVIAQREALGFTLGRDDWWIRGCSSAPFELLCCHESDVHLETVNLQLADQFRMVFSGCGLDLRQVVN
ncbi:hypothetical protein [Deinococcus humi]|uniref:Uncharacterized protein n=1 Tax=Deinococcus humi TaxID=662880 RepID=A0A7W8NFJ3_9DEIO|nr:hypothetical protein [Deinococcus humi]MBB5362027.1 hypothetical protein [Deinococcus humi]